MKMLKKREAKMHSNVSFLYVPKEGHPTLPNQMSHVIFIPIFILTIGLSVYM